MLALSSEPHNAYLEALKSLRQLRWACLTPLLAAVQRVPYSPGFQLPGGLQEDRKNRMAFRSLSFGQKEGNQKRGSSQRPWARLWQGQPHSNGRVTTWVKPQRFRGNELDMKSDKNTRK